MTKARIPTVLHAHFYQPPRDSPWTESVEREASAAPFHDWNARIECECYGANARARVFGEAGRIVDIVNNYAHLSFNIGPTLFSWLELHAPDACRRILEADRESMRRHQGHGSAIAQAYSHAILPLCNPRDRRTQIRWGLADFRRRFGRNAAALWLPETACDLATASDLADHGIRYVILSPHQAQRTRRIDGHHWHDVSDGSIDPRRPYRLNLPSGRSIACFFYDGPTAHALSFGDVLDMSHKLAERLKDASIADRGSNQIVHVATDGETYGHHHRFADRALAYFILHEAEKYGLEITNYAAYLDRTDVTDEVELKLGPDSEGTAWSCAHGLGRWIRDCGCNAGRAQGWRQTWRGPLRTALDLLRDHAANVFETVGGDLLTDVWVARDAYIDVILDPTADARTAFVRTHARSQLSKPARTRLFMLLESQRMNQLMYESCGWFFDDLAGLETTQIMKYAAMCTQLLDAVTDRPFMPKFLEALAEARSNIKHEGNGADILRTHVLSREVTPQLRVADQASRRLFAQLPKDEKDAAFTVVSIDSEEFHRGAQTFVIGRARVTRNRTEQDSEVTYAATTIEGNDMHCGVKVTTGAQCFESLQTDARQTFTRPAVVEVVRMIDRHLGPQTFSVRDLSDAARAEFNEHVLVELLERLATTYSFMFDEHRRTIATLESNGAEVPHELRMVAEYTLARRLEAAVLEAEDSKDPDMFRSALDVGREASELGVTVRAPRATSKFAQLLVDAARGLHADGTEASARHLVDILDLTKKLGLEVPLDGVQDIVFELAHADGLQAVPSAVRTRLLEATGLSPLVLTPECS